MSWMKFTVMEWPRTWPDHSLTILWLHHIIRTFSFICLSNLDNYLIARNVIEIKELWTSFSFRYLTGNQLTSESSIESYISALKNGCRCIERKWNENIFSVFTFLPIKYLSHYDIDKHFALVDIWDGPEGDPIIYHGNTLTGTLPVKDVLNDAIKPYAFKTSSYPLFLSFENHLCLEQQAVLATQIKDAIGGRLETILLLKWILSIKKSKSFFVRSFVSYGRQEYERAPVSWTTSE